MSTDDWDDERALKETATTWDPAEEWERKAQRLRDQQLVNRLSCSGFTGREFVSFVSELAAYGLAICQAWLTSGIVFTLCAQRGRPIGRPPDHWTPEDRDELALETVAVALREFRRHALVGGQWSADGGASLKTYFVGACLAAFPNVFRAWQRGEDRWNRVDLAEPPPDQAATLDDDPASIVALRMDVAENLRGLNARTAAVIILTAEGYTQREIAEALGTTSRAVEGILNRHRHRLANPSDEE